MSTYNGHKKCNTCGDGGDVNMRTTLDLRGMVKSPHDLVEILWEVDGSSGCTICEAWRGQHEIDQLVKAGYTIIWLYHHLAIPSCRCAE